MSAIALRSLTKRYGTVAAVKDLTLEVGQGEFLTLLGPSGCGKTSTLRMIAGFVSPSSGAILIEGADVTGIPPFRREIGLVFQSYALFPHKTVSDNVGFGLKMRKVAAAEARRRVQDALALVRLEALGDRYPSELSGGQQQRVALARALVIRPKLLLLDEPFGALDRALRDHMRAELRALQQSLNLPTIFVTHDQGEALSMSDRIAVMDEGRLEQIGTPDELYERPATRFVASFLGRSNVIELDVSGSDGRTVHLKRGHFHVSTDALPAGATGRQTVMIRPERIDMRRKQAGDPDENVGRVLSATYLGATIESVVAIGDLSIEVSSHNRGDGEFKPSQGDEVLLGLGPNAVWPLRASGRSQ
jgi:spermidine/putrescine ABC transporter ATP-binding subunit